MIDIARNSTFLRDISHLTNFSYSGGTFPPAFGEIIARETRVFGSMASTKIGILPSEIPPPAIWRYYGYNEHFGYTVRRYADDMYESIHIKEPT